MTNPKGSDAERALKDAIRAAGGIVHSDGNIFFTNAEQFLQAARAPGDARPEAIPGWKLVPVEPTPEMLAALWAYKQDSLTDCYRAMLSAAPSPSAVKPIEEKRDGVPWAGLDLDGMVKAFDRVIEAQFQKDSPFHQPINSDAMLALRELKGLVNLLHAQPTASPVEDHVPDTTKKVPLVARQGSEGLSDAEIEELRGEANRGFNIEREDYFKAFRDAEAAHNIKPPSGQGD